MIDIASSVARADKARRGAPRRIAALGPVVRSAVVMIVRLGPASAEQMRHLLLQDPVVNLFLLGFLDAHAVDRATWFGAFDGSLNGLALVVPGRLVVPFAPDPADAGAIGAHLRGRFPPSMLVGPRQACDALWRAWTRDRVTPLRRYDQRLYLMRQPPDGSDHADLRRARPGDWRTVARHAAEMEMEDLGRDPRSGDPALHDRVVRDRIARGVTWVLEDEGEIVFQINVGTTTRLGCQVGGTYVPPEHRGRGVATRGMRAICRVLLRDHDLVTLHVNEGNIPAVRAYERVGFERADAYRLITV